MINLTNEQKELFAYIDGILPGDGHLKYDFRDEKQYEFAVMMSQLSGDADLYPGKLQSLELMKAYQEQHGLQENEPQTADGWTNMFKIPGLNLTTDGTIASNGLATVVGGYASMNLALIVQSRKTKDIVAHGFNNDFAKALLTVSTSASTSNEIDVNSYLHYQYTTSSDSETASPQSGLVKRQDNGGTTGDPVITAPIRTTTKPNNPKAINIGLGRPWTDQGGDSQFDYAWHESTQDHPIGKIPFVGSVTFTQAISTPLEPNTNFLLDIYVADEVGGGGAQLDPTDLNTVYKAFSIDSGNAAKLNWSLPAGASTTDPGNPIVFGNVTWSSDILAYFYCQIAVVLSGGDGSLAFATVQSSDSPDSDPLDGTLNMMPIDFIWHCLGQSTSVTMADGEQRPIADIVAGDKVQINSEGDFAVVQWTNKGAHKGDVYFIRTDDGDELIASHNHVLITEKEPVPASELQEGDVLLTQTGTSKVASISKDTYSGLMYNLATTEYQDPKHFNGKIGTFYANGLQVGDINAQKAYRLILANDMAWVKKQVPDYLHKDVESFFQSKRA